MSIRKPWAVGREDERLWYFDSEAEAVNFAEASIAVDPDELLIVMHCDEGGQRTLTRVVEPPSWGRPDASVPPHNPRPS